MPAGWEWDETLYAGSAAYYERGRLPYPADLADRLAWALQLDGSGRLIDVGCGPGIIALRLAHLFEEVVGVDADRHMLEQAAQRSIERGVANTRWVQMRAEDLPGDLGTFGVATFAQSFHWMDRATVADAVFRMLEPGGAFVLVNHWSLAGEPASDSPYPFPPRDDVQQLVARYLGEPRRAGHGVLLAGTPDGESEVVVAAGFGEPERIALPGGEVVTESVDDIVASCYSASGSAPHLFGVRREEFEHELIALLNQASPSGMFAERVRDAELVVWRK
ncbi:MAG TPA: class I SAM-dependent methyltransferase [Ilumatobacteraceae bacterium]|nr:class I SAM-dependent methyltransferase [Ilumatobacteraceae bacterium]